MICVTHWRPEVEHGADHRTEAANYPRQMSVPESYRLSVPQQITLDIATPARALAIGAHPDDVEFGCGATLAKWAADGGQIFHLICTDGSKGTWDADVDPAELVTTRRREQRNAAHTLGAGADSVVFLDWSDGELESGLRQRWEVAYWIRRFQPDVVLGHDPWRPYRIHPDHRHAGLLACEGIVAARDPKFFPEQGAAPHRPELLLLWEAAVVHHVEQVDGVALEAKVQALLAHESQLETTMRMSHRPSGGADNAMVEEFRARIIAEAHDAGRLAGVETGEAFAAIRKL